MQPQTIAYCLTALTILFWGGAASAFKLALAELSPFSVLLYSAAISSAFLFFLLLGQGKLAQLRRLPGRAIGRALLLGCLNPFLYYMVLFKAYSLLPGQIAMSLNYGWPLMLTLLSAPILGQRLRRSQIAAVAVSFLGAVIIATRGQLTHFGDASGLGLTLALGSTLIWAIFWLFNARDGLDPALKLFLGFCAALVCAVLASPFVGGLTWPAQAAWLPLAYIGLFEMGLTFVLWLSALQRATSAASIGNLIYCTPFLSLLILRVVIGEHIHAATFAGLSLIIGSIIFQEWMARRQA